MTNCYGLTGLNLGWSLKEMPLPGFQYIVE